MSPTAPAARAGAQLLGRHQAAALLGTSADFAAMIALVELAGLAPPTATVLSAAIGGVVNFALSRGWAFRGAHVGGAGSQAARYALASLGGALLNATLLALALRVVSGPYVALRVAIAVGVSLAYTYPVHTRFVFRVVGSERASGEPVWSRPTMLVAPFVAYAAWSFLRHDLRFDHFAVIAIVGGLALLGKRTKELVVGLYPVGLVFILYDGMRPYQRLGLTEARVHLCDLRALEATLFGSGGRTIHDFWQTHSSPALDLLCAVPYATFILWSIVGGIYLYLRDRPAMRRFMWAFFVLNVAGFVTYHLLPAAPPWYFHAHGCVVDLATKASEGPALARVDAMLGVPYFHGMYGKASSVFGALPSLHCGYPLLLALAGWRSFGPKLRAFSVVYYVWMVFSAVYLDHHWLLDALLGSVYAAGALALVVFVERRRPRAAALA